MSSNINKLLEENPVVPVVVIEDARHAAPLADALVKGGITTMEITLRTDAALDAIKILKKERPEISVGAGTVTSIEKLNASIEAGVDYIVSPGASYPLLEALAKCNVPVLPGIATISEAMTMLELGISTLKFFPAGINGGPKALKAFASVLPDIKFCPTGGVNVDNMNEYLSLDNVAAIGGSWLTPAKLVKEEKWDEITELAKAAVAKAKA